MVYDSYKVNTDLILILHYVKVLFFSPSTFQIYIGICYYCYTVNRKYNDVTVTPQV